MADEIEKKPAASEGEAQSSPDKKPKPAPRKKDAEGEAASAPAAATESPPKDAKVAPPKKGVKKDAAPGTVALSLDDSIEPLKIVKAKGSKNVIHGIAHVQASFNNTGNAGSKAPAKARPTRLRWSPRTLASRP